MEDGKIRLPVRLVTNTALKPHERQVLLRLAQKRKVVQQPVMPVRVTTAMAFEAYEQEQATNQWTPLGLLGLWYVLWKEHHHLDVRRATIKEDLREVEILHQRVGEMAEWCIRAMFSEHMHWVKDKRLDFFDGDRLYKYVVGIASEMRKMVRPEWKQAAQPGGLLWKPKGAQ